MPFPFVLPTTSSFAFAAAFACPSHPSLLRTASTYRGIVRDALKKHKRLPPEAQAAHLPLVVGALRDYLPYLLAVVDGSRVAGSGPDGARIVVTPLSASPSSSPSSPPALPQWRPTLSPSRLPGRPPARVGARSLDEELAFVLATLGHALTLQARVALQPLYVAASVVPVGPQQRLAAITAATRHLLDAASVLTFAAERAESAPSPSLSSAAASPPLPPPSPEIAPSLLRAHAALALAEATLLAVLKDDPYPAAVAQDRNDNDREWMFKAPDLPKVRAHLFARLCLAAADHASRAAGSASVAAAQPVPSAGIAGSLSASPYFRYLTDLRHTSRAKACRFFAVDAELGGQTGTALAWLAAADAELSGATKSAKDVEGGSGARSLLGRFRKERSERSEKRSEKKEDRRIERGANWGADAGRFEESRVLAMLDAKWTKQNDTMNTQRIPPSGPLLAQMPSGREIHTVKPFEPPVLDSAVLDAMRAPPDPLDGDEAGLDAADDSSDEDTAGTGSGLSGSYSGTRDDHGGRRSVF